MNRQFSAIAASACLFVACLVGHLGNNATAQVQQGGSTTVQLPTFGVSIDAEGVLKHRRFDDPGGKLRAERIAAARAALAPDLQKRSAMRKVSLARLDRAIAALAREGKSPDDAMRRLAGLTRIEYVFCYPDRGDIVIAGPAEGWVADAAGRAIGLESGLPTLELVDLAVALHAYPPGGKRRPFVGCTINPTAEGLARLAAFQKTIPRSVSTREREIVSRRVGEGMRESLGLAEILAFGVPPESHFARVMIEADYRMKLIGIGLEEPPVRIASYLELLSSAPRGVQRWWFTPDYECVRASDDRLAMQLVGEGVRLQTENKTIGPNGKLMEGSATDGASERFVAGFTAKYPQLAAKSPVFAQLRTLVDLCVAAAFLQHEDCYGRAGWRPSALADEKILPVATEEAPRRAPAAVNCVWKGNRMLAPAGGGVSIQAHEALSPERLLKDDGHKLSSARESTAGPTSRDAWWWD